MINNGPEKSCLIYLIHGDDLLSLFKNNLISAKKCNIQMEKIAYINRANVKIYQDTCHEFDVEIVPIDIIFNELNYSNYGTQGFNVVTSYKWAIIIDALKRGYKNAIYSDVDIVYIADFEEYIKNASHLYKCGVQSESSPKFSTECCTGLMFFRCDAIPILEQLVEINRMNISLGNDQDIFNKIYIENSSFQKEVHLLPEAIFQNGLHYKNFIEDSYEPIRGKIQPFLFHANYVLGLEAKIALLKKVGLWQLS